MLPELLGRWRPWVWPTLQAFRQFWLFLSAAEVADFVASFPDSSPELSVASWDDPSTLLQEEVSVLFFCSFKHNLCFCFCPRNPPLSTFSFIQVCPGSLPLTPANLIQLASGSSLLARKHSPKWSRRRQDRGGHGFGGAQAPPPSSSFLPALQRGFREGTSVCFPGVNA